MKFKTQHIGKCFFLFLGLLWGMATQAQVTNNPVQVTNQLIPPYTLYLSDYGSLNANKWNISLMLKDFTKTDYQAKLRITIEGGGIRLRTRQGYHDGPIFLDPGIPYVVTADVLADYMQLQNLEVDGISRQQLGQTQRLPEGFYRFTVEVLDFQRNKVVSNVGTAMAWLMLNDPPLLNMPFDPKLRPTEPQQVQFSWTPRHMGSPNSVFSTEYTFRLWEIWPADRNPNEVVRTSAPIVEKQLSLSSYFYGPADIPLVLGRRYAWQVQAVDLEGRDLFRNQGKSEVRSFQYGDECLQASGLGAEAMGTDVLKVSWQADWNHTNFVLQWRKEGATDWNNEGTNITTKVLYDLQANTRYELRVSPSCGPIAGEETPSITIATLDQDSQSLDCGAESQLPTISNREPVAELLVGDVITAAGFKVKIISLERNGDIYSGLCGIEVPLFNNAKMEARLINVEVNTDMQLISGRVETTLNPNGAFIIGLDSQPGLSEDGTSGSDGSEETPDTDVNIDEVITDVEVDEETGEIIVTTEDGETTTIDPDEEGVDENEDGDIVIEDSNGDTWVVGPDGNVSSPSESDNIQNDEVGWEKDESLRFLIDGDEYENRDNYYTMLTGEELTISLFDNDENSNINFEELEWQLNEDIIETNEDKKSITLELKEEILKENRNILIIYNKEDKKIIKLKIKLYSSPLVFFTERENFNGEYFFDRGYEFDKIRNQYSSFTSSKGDTYYSPILGLGQNETAVIRIENINNIRKLIEKDPDFSLVLKASDSGKVFFDNQPDSLVLDKEVLNSSDLFAIKAVQTIDGEEMTSIDINVFVQSTREKVGMIKYYCADRSVKDVDLIYIKFANESSYPNYLNPEMLDIFLNSNSMNQLFLKFNIDSVYRFTSSYEKDDVEDWDNLEILTKLTLEYFDKETPDGYDKENDYYFITNLSIEVEENKKKGAFHRMGSPGGVALKINSDKANSATAHEFGHWVDLTHTFYEVDKNNDVIVNSKGGTNNNFMDYDITRTKWVKFQLLNHNH